MIKKIPLQELRIGMYVHDLNVDWMSHPFLRDQFLLNDEADLLKITQLGVHDLYIDTSRGLDVSSNAPTAAEVKAEIESEMLKSAEMLVPLRITATEEMLRAKKIHGQAHNVVRAVMRDARLGQAISMDQVEEVVEGITESILRNSGALIGLSGIKNKDEYTFLHSVSVCTLMVTFAHSMGLGADVVRLAGVGGLLHDTGKIMVPNEILNKPGKLTDAEFEIMRSHPEEGWKIIRQIAGIQQIPLDITLLHHERMDGSGYPQKMPGDEIPQIVRMSSIVDVYDAITSDRCYHRGMPAPDGLRKLWEWSKFHFDPTLVQAFMRTVGIYPVGSLVRLESGRLGVVLDQNESNLLMPKVKAIFSTKSDTYITPQEIDLSRTMGRGGADRIVGHEDPGKWKIDISRYLQVV
jgi:putative nucleotidyltransferase with HDIG domain